jgi:hypothetical protein
MSKDEDENLYRKCLADNLPLIAHYNDRFLTEQPIGDLNCITSDITQFRRFNLGSKLCHN